MKCPVLEPINGNASSTATDFGTEAVIECRVGYRINNVDQRLTVTCNETGQWLPTDVVCQRITSCLTLLQKTVSIISILIYTVVSNRRRHRGNCHLLIADFIVIPTLCNYVLSTLYILVTFSIDFLLYFVLCVCVLFFISSFFYFTRLTCISLSILNEIK